MTRSSETRRLGEIVAVRDLQCFAATQRAGQAAAHLRDSRGEVEACETRARVTADGWLDAVARESLVPELATAWADAMVHRQSMLRDAGNAASQAETVARERAGEWHAAVTRQDVVRDRLTRSRRAASARGDEATLLEVTDVMLRRRRA